MRVEISPHQSVSTLLNIMSKEEAQEHIFLNIKIYDVSRALLQEHVRHQHLAGLSVKSSRYTLNELSKEPEFSMDSPESISRASDYLRFTGDLDTDENSVIMLEALRSNVKRNRGKNLDIVKYNLPESYLTSLTWTINLKGLFNYIELRTSKAALLEIQELAGMIDNQLTKEIKSLRETTTKRTMLA